MHKIIKISLCSVAILVLLGGCSGANTADNNPERKKAEESSASRDTFISVQEYSGKVTSFLTVRKPIKSLNKIGTRLRKPLKSFFRKSIRQK
ncbi:hypothetical protein LLY41_02495 [Cytobacillus firmus]|uniref:hypothetical protein n=1 Tax=Cytobacillus firmus TaxID=1399 RepID=UPI002188393E|nr:hypothetical protein [Cytobacillus firmus]URM33372.1 hypothetical protein LLY41_02495 [Cytobacillus firmus]